LLNGLTILIDRVNNVGTSDGNYSPCSRCNRLLSNNTKSTNMIGTLNMCATTKFGRNTYTIMVDNTDYSNRIAIFIFKKRFCSCVDRVCIAHLVDRDRISLYNDRIDRSFYILDLLHAQCSGSSKIKSQKIFVDKRSCLFCLREKSRKLCVEEVSCCMSSHFCVSLCVVNYQLDHITY
jgi:hypothetical protein